MGSATPFPGRTSTFHGRAADLEAIAACIEGADRLVTIVGPGGIGKTRLATEAARAELRKAPKGTEGPWFCDLSEALTAANICACFASALDVALSGSSVESHVVQLGHALASRPRALVVLDNFEQVVDHAPETLVRWLSMAEDARFLVTSRERLRVAGEIVFELGSLPLPRSGEDPLTSDAVSLYLDRTRGGPRVRELTPDDLERVAEIVCRLDGMPLAIELAASRAALLTPASLLARLARPLEVLSLGQRGAVSRHATLATTIAWSWSLLAAHEQEALAQCSVFAGGFTLAAAEEILELSAPPSGERPAVIDVLQALRDASLLRVYATSDTDAESRFGLFETIREFAYDKLLASGGLAGATRRHATYYLREGQGWAEALLGPQGPQEMRRLEVERHNVVAIARRATATAPPNVSAASEAISAMRILEPPAFSGFAADRNGMLASILSYADAAVTASAASATAEGTRGIDGSSWAYCWLAHGRALGNKGATAEGLEALERALALAQDAGDACLEGTALVCVALYTWSSANDESSWARGPMQRALDFPCDVGDERGKAYVMACQTCLSARFNQDGGSVERIVELGERTFYLLRRRGNRLMEGAVEHHLGFRLANAGLLANARAHCERALLICPEFGSPWVLAGTHWVLGAIALEGGELLRAAEQIELAILSARRSGSPVFEGPGLMLLGLLHHEERRTGKARETLERALTVMRVRQWPSGLGGALGALCVVAADELRLDEAEDLLRQSGDQLALTREPERAIADLLPGFLEVARATLAADGDADVEALVWLDKARARADAAARAERVLPRSHLVRLFTRLLGHAIDKLVYRARALQLGAEAAWFKPPGGARVKVVQQSPRLLLLHLAEARERSPGRAIGREQLFRSGWPGERAGHDTVVNRLSVAIATLRKLGLGGLLVTHDDGWLLEPSIPLIRVP